VGITMKAHIVVRVRLLSTHAAIKPEMTAAKNRRKQREWPRRDDFPRREVFRTGSRGPNRNEHGEYWD
jgi:hypothetical protein